MKRLIQIRAPFSEAARLQSFAVKHDVAIAGAVWDSEDYNWSLSVEGLETSLSNFNYECEMFKRGLTDTVNAG